MKPRNEVMFNFSLLKIVRFIKMGASTPQQQFPVWVCMFPQVSCGAAQFLTLPSLPHFVLLQLCTAVVPPGLSSGASSGHWEELGHKTGTEPGGQVFFFFIKTALLLSAGFFEWRSCIWNLLEELLWICAFSKKQPWLEERLEIKCAFLLSRCKPPWFVSEENPYSSCFRIFG